MLVMASPLHVMSCDNRDRNIASMSKRTEMNVSTNVSKRGKALAVQNDSRRRHTMARNTFGFGQKSLIHRVTNFVLNMVGLGAWWVLSVRFD
jgi:hypothetical protein